MDTESKAAEKLSTKKQACKSKTEKLKSAIDGLNFSPTQYSSLERESHDLSASVTSLKDTMETLSAQLEGRLKFEYSDPVRGFDRSKVKGLVASLVRVKKQVHTTALEVVAGGKLYQVVVDEVITGKALLAKGQLQRRVTIIPLDKIQPRHISSIACDRASQIATELDASASPAIELVCFDEEIRNAMEYVFGGSLVIDSPKAANRICDETKTRTVTLEGDVYDPSGTISGGSRNNLGTTLSKLSELATAHSELSTKQSRLREISAQLDAMQSKFVEFERLSEKLELAEAELKSADRHLSQTSFGMLSKKHDSIEKEIGESRTELEEMEREKEMKWQLFCELKEKEQELTQEREVHLDQIHQEVQQAKQVMLDKTQHAREAESRAQTLKLEMDSLKAEMMASEQAVTSAEKAMSEATENEAKLQIRVGEASAKFEAARAELDEAEKEMTVFSSELGHLKSARADLVKKAESLDLEAKKLTVMIKRIEKERASAERSVATMQKKHNWIESEKSAFGVPGGDYDFAAINMNEMGDRLQALREEQDLLSKKINKKVMGMIEKAEAEYTELLRKRKVVENDKKKIQAVIEELDVKKKSELERTWVKVNRDFGSIFSTLLPGASAKLEPPEGLEAWEGLEVKVAFGDVWKESLSELSGGQRSLLALSLILSLLLFKPAPMYILDEVDAALDLSHTQNIGNMLKTHFSHSQFIVVSLKVREHVPPLVSVFHSTRICLLGTFQEGMFNNANVIFRTKFVDGVSTVNRTIGTGTSRARTILSDSNEEDPPPVRKRAARVTNRPSGKENVVT